MLGLLSFVIIQGFMSREIIYQKVGAIFEETKSNFLTKNQPVTSRIYDGIQFNVSRSKELL